MRAVATIDPPVRTAPAARHTSPFLRQLGALASWRVWTVTALVYAASAFAFFRSTAAFAIPHVQDLCGEPPLDMRTTSTAPEVNEFLTTCGSAGREAYRALQMADLLYPLVFATFLASSLALVVIRLAPSRPRLLSVALLPFVASAFDYIENALAWRALTAFPLRTSTDGWLGVASLAKTLTSWVAGGLLIAGVAGLLLAAALRVVGKVRDSNHRATLGTHT